MHRYYGLDIGGTKIELVACNESLDVGHRRRIDTPQQDYDAFLDAIVELVRMTDDELGGSCGGVGVALPGVMDRTTTGRQLSANVPALTGRTVGHDLRQLLQRPLHFGNDLQCLRCPKRTAAQQPATRACSA